MNENLTSDGHEAEADIGAALPVPVGNRKLSIPKKRLAGSPHCLNCGTALQGPFCHFCGQPDKNFLRFFPVLMRELLEDFVDFDSRFMRTLKPLLFRPGKLTRDYLDGKRFRYVPPLRLYIFSSIAFFFIAAILAVDGIKIGSAENAETDGIGMHITVDPEDEEELKEALQGLNDIEPGLGDQIAESVEQARSQAAENAKKDYGEGHAEEDGEDVININGEPWDRETNPFIIDWMPDRVNDWINDEIGESPAKGKAIEENPDLIKDKVFEVLPATMFVLLPIVALLLKFWYLFAKKFYVEHLIFALHNHSFIFVLALLMMATSTVAGWIDPAEESTASQVSGWVIAVLSGWIPIYLLFSLRRVYRQGWGMTIGKYMLIGISYTMLLAFATAAAGVLSFILL